MVCKKCGLEQLPDCDGSGHIPVSDDLTTMGVCRNFYAKMLKMHMGPEISSVKHARVSPLLQRDSATGKAVVDRSSENLHIYSRWGDLLPHLKLLLVFKSLDYTFKIVTDEEIKRVFLGNEHFRVVSEDKKGSSKNTLSDLLGDVDLAIIKLGYIGYKNKAAPGALLEALFIRDSLKKPTWVVQDPEYEWNHSRGWDVEKYLKEKFENVLTSKVSVTHMTTPPKLERPRCADIGIEDDTLPWEESKKKKSIQDESDFELELPSGGGGNKKFPRRI